MGDHEKFCRVCGLFFADFYPWGENGQVPSHDICDCCGTEFGYEDTTLEAIRRARKKWLNGGAKWTNPGKTPSNWDCKEQLKKIPERFR